MYTFADVYAKASSFDIRNRFRGGYIPYNGTLMYVDNTWGYTETAIGIARLSLRDPRYPLLRSFPHISVVVDEAPLSPSFVYADDPGFRLEGIGDRIGYLNRLGKVLKMVRVPQKGMIQSLHPLTTLVSTFTSSGQVLLAGASSSYTQCYFRDFEGLLKLNQNTPGVEKLAVYMGFSKEETKQIKKSGASLFEVATFHPGISDMYEGIYPSTGEALYKVPRGGEVAVSRRHVVARTPENRCLLIIDDEAVGEFEDERVTFFPSKEYLEGDVYRNLGVKSRRQ